MKMSKVIRAIDVGFGNTKFVTASDGRRIECSHFPSVSYFGGVDKGNEGFGGKRKTVNVPVGEIFYTVGPDIELMADRFRPSNQDDEFTETREYRAFMGGALHFMKVERVDLLVVGLPVAQFVARRSALQKAMTGPFDVGGRRKVEVKHVLVVAQPQGALVDYANTGGRELLNQGQSLVVDAGYRTFDWLVTRGMRVVTGMSSSIPRGMHEILVRISERLSHEIQGPYEKLDEIDQALRSGGPLRINLQDHDLKQKKYSELAHAVAEDAIKVMSQRIGDTSGVENIVLVGGAAPVFRKALKKRFPKHTIREGERSLYANVRGFQMIGEQYAREKAGLFELPKRAAEGQADNPNVA
jgi:plasmid segregation protein ParM